MKNFFILIIICFTLASMVNAKNLTTQEAVKFGSDVSNAINYPDGRRVYSRYARTPNELAAGISSNLEQFESNNEGKKIGSAMCIVHVLDNGNLALTFFSDEELQKFHEETDNILDKYYGGYDATGFQYLSKDTQTHVTTMLLKRIEKKKKSWFKK